MSIAMMALCRCESVSMESVERERERVSIHTQRVSKRSHDAPDVSLSLSHLGFPELPAQLNDRASICGVLMHFVKHVFILNICTYVVKSLLEFFRMPKRDEDRYVQCISCGAAEGS